MAEKRTANVLSRGECFALYIFVCIGIAYTLDVKVLAVIGVTTFMWVVLRIKGEL